MIYYTPDTKATPASVQGVGVDFYIDMDFASPQRFETFVTELRDSVVFSVAKTVFSTFDVYCAHGSAHTFSHLNLPVYYPIRG
jgi:hypothetical protein